MGSVVVLSSMYFCKEFCNDNNANEKRITINIKPDKMHKSNTKKESLITKKK